MVKNVEKKKSFLILNEQIEGMKDVSDKQFREVIMAMYEIGRGNEPVVADPLANYIVNSKKSWAVERRNNYEETCRRNRENGKNGGRPRITGDNPEKPDKPSGLSENQNNPGKPKQTKKNQREYKNPDEPGGSEKNRKNPEKPDSDYDIDYDVDVDKEQEHEHEHDNNNGKIINKVEKPAIAIAPAGKNKKIKSAKYEVDFSKDYWSWPEMEAELRKLFPDFSLDKKGADYDFSKFPPSTIYSKNWLSFIAGIYAEKNPNDDLDIDQLSRKYGGTLINNIWGFLEGCSRSASEFAAANRAKEKRKR
ncbi:MAG: hypothetical protein LBD62_04685 [Candidatus Margulisbacteria bacterium]|jgi:hypothetical protein|nr:hypothetical protein [Candidatus Margulisiibacteriota bacterium]